MKKLLAFSLIALLFCFWQNIFSPAFSAQSDYFLKLDNIQGEDSLKGENGWIKLYSVQYNQSDLQFLQRAASQIAQDSNPVLTINKQVDSSSPWLMDYVALGEPIKSGTLALCNDETCDTINLSNISIIRFGLNTTAAPAIETVVLKTSILSSSSAVEIPGWIKNNAKWFAEGSIGESDFTKGIEYMIKEGIMKIPNLPPRASDVAESKVPDWIRNNAKWWSEGQITDNDFVKGIQYLVEKGIIKI